MAVIEKNMTVRISRRPSLDILIQNCLLYTVSMTPYPKQVKSTGQYQTKTKGLSNQNLEMLQADIGVENEYQRELSMSKPRVEPSRK